MQIWAESGKSALPICNYSQILYQFLTFTQNLKRSPKATLARLVNQIEKRGISYENTAHRNFRFIILIISQEDCFSETTDYLNNLISHKNLSFISIESMKEEQLFSE